MKFYTLFLGLLMLLGCKNTSKYSEQEPRIQEKEKEAVAVEPDRGIGGGATSIESMFINRIESAHKKKAFLKHSAIRFDVDLSFGGKQRLDATITMLANSSKIKIEKKDGSTLLFDGNKVYLSPKTANDKGARFDIFTWTYFFGFPYKLSDPGTQWKMQEDRKLQEETYATAKLTFDNGTGDAPDDWYITYVNPNTYIIRAAAYIVTYGSNGDISNSESDPHIIVYDNYTMIEEIPIASSWRFYGWTSEKGITEALGEATLSNIRFLDNPDDFSFTVPENSKIIPSPQ